MKCVLTGNDIGDDRKLYSVEKNGNPTTLKGLLCIGNFSCVRPIVLQLYCNDKSSDEKLHSILRNEGLSFLMVQSKTMHLAGND